MDCSGSRKIRINGLCEEHTIDTRGKSNLTETIQELRSAGSYLYDPLTFIIISIAVMFILCIVAIVIFQMSSNRRRYYTFVHAGYQPVVVVLNAEPPNLLV